MEWRYCIITIVCFCPKTLSCLDICQIISVLYILHSRPYFLMWPLEMWGWKFSTIKNWHGVFIIQVPSFSSSPQVLWRMLLLLNVSSRYWGEKGGGIIISQSHFLKFLWKFDRREGRHLREHFFVSESS